MKTAIELAERGLVPDWITRRGIRQSLRDRLREIYGEDHETNLRRVLEESNDSGRTFLESDPAARRFQKFFVRFQEAIGAGEVHDVYAQDAYLNDSLKELYGADASDAYFGKTLDTATLVRLSERSRCASRSR